MKKIARVYHVFSPAAHNKKKAFKHFSPAAKRLAQFSLRVVQSYNTPSVRVSHMLGFSKMFRWRNNATPKESQYITADVLLPIKY